MYSDKALQILHGGQRPFTVLLNVCTVQLILEVSKKALVLARRTYTRTCIAYMRLLMIQESDLKDMFIMIQMSSEICKL